MKHIVVLTALTLLYFYLLTVLFEYCINKASSTALTLAGIAAFLVLSFFYASFILKTIKKYFK